MRVAIIGASHWHAGMHLKSLQLAGDVQIVGISDQRMEAAEALVKQAGGNVFADYAQMLEVTQPEFVLAMGRPVDMPAIGEELISANIPCALEKPVGISARDVAPLVELARKKQAFVAVPFTNRYSAMWSWLNRLDEAGRVGIRSHAHFRIINGPPQRYERDGVGWMLEPEISGGGSMRNLGIHAADAFLHFVGEPVEVLKAAVSHRIYNNDVEEMGMALLRSESGVLGTIEAGYTFASMNSGDYESRMATSNCTIVDRGNTLRLATLDDNHEQELTIPNQPTRYDRFCVDTLKRFRNGQPPIASIEDCYEAMLLIDKIYETAVHIPYHEE